MNLHDYIIDHTGFDWPKLLEEWHWLLPSEFTVWLLTRTGDLFIALPDDSIRMLDVGAGTLQPVAQSRDEFCGKIDDPNRAKEWLMWPVVDELVNADMTLHPGYCYSFKKLPILGGTYSAENRIALPIREHFGAWGSVHHQVSDVSDGTKVVLKTTNQPGAPR